MRLILILITHKNAHYYLWFKYCVLGYYFMTIHEPLAPADLDGNGLVPLALTWEQPSEGY